MTALEPSAPERFRPGAASLSQDRAWVYGRSRVFYDFLSHELA